MKRKVHKSWESGWMQREVFVTKTNTRCSNGMVFGCGATYESGNKEKYCIRCNLCGCDVACWCWNQLFDTIGMLYVCMVINELDHTDRLKLRDYVWIYVDNVTRSVARMLENNRSKENDNVRVGAVVLANAVNDKSCAKSLLRSCAQLRLRAQWLSDVPPKPSPRRSRSHVSQDIA